MIIMGSQGIDIDHHDPLVFSATQRVGHFVKETNQSNKVSAGHVHKSIPDYCLSYFKVVCADRIQNTNIICLT